MKIYAEIILNNNFAKRCHNSYHILIVRLREYDLLNRAPRKYPKVLREVGNF